MNSYYENLQFVKSRLISYMTEIFRVYGNELMLRLEDYNLLQNTNNCIETSTATGFIMEEFIISKLEIYTSTFDGVENVKVLRVTNCSTVDNSFDCYVEYRDIYVMVNIKVEKFGSDNNAVAAINKLYQDYVIDQAEREKGFLVLKTKYFFAQSVRDGQKKIFVDGIEGYWLEEFDFSLGHQHDNRNWSNEFNPNSGRLQLSRRWRERHLLPTEEISYQRTKDFLIRIFR